MEITPCTPRKSKHLKKCERQDSSSLLWAFELEEDEDVQGVGVAITSNAKNQKGYRKNDNGEKFHNSDRGRKTQLPDAASYQSACVSVK